MDGRDIFDNPPKGPAGVHRGNRSLAVRVAPFIVVVVLAALAGLAAWGVFTGEIKSIHWPWQTSSVQAQTKQPEQTTKDDASKDGDDTGAAGDADADASGDAQGTDDTDPNETGDGQQPAEEPEENSPTVNKSTQVCVVNGTGRTGYAAQQAQVLTGAGYTAVEARNPTGTLPNASAVWYMNEADQATAQDVATTLGIANVQQVSNLSAPVVAVLMN